MKKTRCLKENEIECEIPTDIQLFYMCTWKRIVERFLYNYKAVAQRTEKDCFSCTIKPGSHLWNKRAQNGLCVVFFAYAGAYFTSVNKAGKEPERSLGRSLLSRSVIGWEPYAYFTSMSVLFTPQNKHETSVKLQQEERKVLFFCSCAYSMLMLFRVCSHYLFYLCVVLILCLCYFTSVN